MKRYRNKANEEKPKATVGKKKNHEEGEDKTTKSSELRRINIRVRYFRG